MSTGKQRSGPPSQQRVLQSLYLKLMFRTTKFGRKDTKLIGPAGSLFFSSLFFVLFGMVAFVFSGLSFPSFASSLHTMTFLMVGMNLALVSGNLLFNKDEGDVLLHRPVEPKAMLAAKVRVIVLVSMIMALALNLGGFIAGVMRKDGTWLFLPAHFVALVLQVLFSASFVVLAYNLCLRWFGREKLENLMTAVQVVVAIAIVAGSQIVPRVLGSVHLTEVTTIPAWAFALPPLWFGGIDAVLTGRASSPMWYGLAAVGVLATGITTWFGVNRLAATYEQGLVTLNEAGPSAVRPGGSRRQAGRWLLRLPFVSRWVRDPVERAAFQLTLAYLSRSRGVKLRVYPMLGQFLVYPVIIFFGGRAGTGSFGEPMMFAFCGAFIAMLPALVIDILRLSEDWRAADLFWYVPVAKPAAIFHGTRKAVITMLCVPGLLLVLMAGALYLRERSAVLLLLLPGILTIPVLSLIPSLARPFTPFSVQPEVQAQNSSGCIYSVIFVSSSMAIAGASAVAWQFGMFEWLLLAEIPVVGLLLFLLHSVVDRRPLPPAP